MGSWSGQAATAQWTRNVDYWTYGWRTEHRTFNEVCESGLDFIQESFQLSMFAKKVYSLKWVLSTITKTGLGFRQDVPKDVADLSGQWLDVEVNGTNVFQGTSYWSYVDLWGCPAPPPLIDCHKYVKNFKLNILHNFWHTKEARTWQCESSHEIWTTHSDGCEECVWCTRWNSSQVQLGPSVKPAIEISLEEDQCRAPTPRAKVVEWQLKSTINLKDYLLRIDFQHRVFRQGL